MRQRLFRNPFPLLIIIFLLSVAVRIPTLNRPLSKHHEFCTAVALRVLQIWDEAGIKTYHFNPVMNYPHPADKFINNFASASGEMTDGDGNFYYVSHPPLGYYLPYFVFSLLSIHPGVLSIQIYNLFLHFISALGVYFIICHFLRIKWNAELNLVALSGFVFYLFNPATMWFQSNTYMSDMAVQPFFIFAVLAALKFFEDGKKNHLILLVLLIFLMTYTTWLGVFFTASLMLLVIIRWKKISSPFFLTTLFFSASLAAIALTVFQYSQIAGWNSYWHEATGRFAERSGIDGGSQNVFPSITSVIWNYVTSYASLFIFLAILLIFFRKNIQSTSKQIVQFTWISVLPVIMLHIVLLNYSVHDFTTLYVALFLSVVAAILAGELLKRGKTFFVTFLSLYVLLNVAQYYYINRPGEISFSGERYADMRNAGISIRNQSSPDEVIFSVEKASPEIIFYAGRNIQHVNNVEDAKNFLKKYSRSKGVVFKITNDKAEAVERLR